MQVSYNSPAAWWHRMAETTKLLFKSARVNIEFTKNGWKQLQAYYPQITSDYVGADDPFQPVAAARAERIAKAKAEAGITEETSTWSGWKEAGFEVLHGSKALFSVELIHGSKGDGANYKASFFGASQVRAVA